MDLRPNKQSDYRAGCSLRHESDDLILRTAADVLAAVQKGLSQYDINTVATVGHSLGKTIFSFD